MERSVQQIGRYQILEKIATGDLAEVFKARKEGLAGFKRLFAIKRIRPHLARLETYAQLIEEEAKIAGLLSHGNIVQLLDIGRDGGSLYLVMEFVDGWDLGAVLAASRERGKALPVSHAAWIGVQLLKALEYAHRREIERGGETVPLNLVHRDVSPSNVLLSRAGDVKLTDFGIARAANKVGATHPDLVTRRFEYTSPEAAGGGDVTQAADLFAVGVLLYECLTLVNPFRRPGEMATLDAVRDGRFVPLRTLRPDVQPQLAGVVESAMAHDPTRRPPSATTFKDQLSEVLLGQAEVFSHETFSVWLHELFGEAAPQPAAQQVDVTLDELPSLSMEDDVLADVLIEDPELPDLPATPDATEPAPNALPDDVETTATAIGRARSLPDPGAGTTSPRPPAGAPAVVRPPVRAAPMAPQANSPHPSPHPSPRPSAPPPAAAPSDWDEDGEARGEAGPAPAPLPFAPLDPGPSPQDADEAATVALSSRSMALPPQDTDTFETVVVRAELEKGFDEEAGPTVVNKELAAQLKKVREERGEGAFADPNQTRLRPDSLPRFDDDRSRKSAPSAAPRPGPPSVAVTAAQAAGLLFVGALVGVLAAVLAVRTGGLVAAAPVLEVRPAPGVPMVVKVDGEVRDGPSRLAPGPHALRVEVAGAPAWDVELTLEASEYRLVLIETLRAEVPAEPEAN